MEKKGHSHYLWVSPSFLLCKATTQREILLFILSVLQLFRFAIIRSGMLFVDNCRSFECSFRLWANRALFVPQNCIGNGRLDNVERLVCKLQSMCCMSTWQRNCCIHCSNNSLRKQLFFSMLNKRYLLVRKPAQIHYLTEFCASLATLPQHELN